MPLGKSDVAGNCTSGPASCTSVFLKLPRSKALISACRFLPDPPGRNRHDPRPRSECKSHTALRLFMADPQGNHRPNVVCLDAFSTLRLWFGCFEGAAGRPRSYREKRLKSHSLCCEPLAWPVRGSIISRGVEAHSSGCKVGVETDANVTAGCIKQTNLEAQIAASFLVQLHWNSDNNTQNCLYRGFWMLVFQSHSYSLSLNWWFSFKHGSPSCTCPTCPHKQAQAVEPILPVPICSLTKAAG